MKAIVINGSPRKNWNTAQAIDKAAERAESLYPSFQMRASR